MKSTGLLALLALGLSHAGFSREIQFNRDVRPILSDKCYGCHGPGAAARKIPFRLDSEEAAKADLGKGRYAVVEGDVEKSELVRRVSAQNKAQRMPPVYSGITLTPREIETLREWVAQGAKWQRHWAFLPPVRPAIPAVKNPAWVRNGIDSFVLARLDRENLQPAVEASKETLIRRVTFDLTGLPPTPAEIDAFVKDRSPQAYARIVDRLLASPRYGERMAYRWLDAARYADSNGYQYDGERVMWRWRDWVIHAFNANKPYDQFALEQLAGDLLPDATREQKIATGFNRNHRINTEEGLIPEEYAVEYVVDRVETTSAVFLGLTLGCARCHNHKYDPFAQKEFYQVYAYFNNVPELGRGMKYGNSPPVVPSPTADQARADQALDERIAAVNRWLQSREKKLKADRARWEQRLPSSEPAWWRPSANLETLTLKAVGAVPEVAGRFGKAWQFDGKSFFDAGKETANFDIEDRWTISVWLKAEQKPDGSLVSRMADEPKGKGFGIHCNQGKVQVNLTSNWVSDAIRMETRDALTPGDWHHVAVSYDGSRLASGVHIYVDGKAMPVDIQLDTLYRPFRNAGHKFTEPLRVASGLGAEHRFRGTLEDVRIYARALTQDELQSLALSESVNEIARKPASVRSPVEQRELTWFYLEHDAPSDLRKAWQDLVALGREKEKLERSFPTTMVMAESPVPKKTHLLLRGAYDRPGEEVQPGLPAALPPLPAGAPNNRLGFARWLTSPRNPLFARVTVNRMWQMDFGVGLVKTSEDFGSQGEWPSNPDLLDWLATEFVRSGWDLKALQKLIVSSATYRQSSAETPELIQRDPENRLLARGPRVRLAPEMVRDQALAAAGLLSEKLGGPSVKPYQPDGLWKELSMQDMDYNQDHGADLHRRSLYTFWKRTVAPPFMMNFDAANREACVVRENRTNTPLQALNLMNDVTFVEAGRAIGQRMLREGGAGDANRLRYGFRLVTARWPSANEERVLLNDLQFHREYFRADGKRTKQYLSQGEFAVDSSLDAVDVASYGAVGALLLNLDETITKE